MWAEKDRDLLVGISSLLFFAACRVMNPSTVVSFGHFLYDTTAVAWCHCSAVFQWAFRVLWLDDGGFW